MKVIRRHMARAEDERCLWVVFHMDPLVPGASVYSGTHQPARRVSTFRFAAVRSRSFVSMNDGMGPRRMFVVAVLRLALAPFSIVRSLDHSSFLAESSCRCCRFRRIIAQDKTINIEKKSDQPSLLRSSLAPKVFLWPYTAPKLRHHLRIETCSTRCHVVHLQCDG